MLVQHPDNWLSSLREERYICRIDRLTFSIGNGDTHESICLFGT